MLRRLITVSNKLL